MKERRSILSRFHPLIAGWFGEKFGRPTDVQEKAWEGIAAGDHLLITAPTGTGKTLAAFLWALNQLLSGEWPFGVTSVLYVSPLRALNNDIQRNLLEPLGELKEIFRRSGEEFPDIRVLTRSGDTPQADRRRMLRHPPEILITTPESFNLLLSSGGGRSILGNIATVILDEIHAVVGSKRGVYLITAVDRLIRLSGEFQRIALSATLRPVEAVSRFVAGFRGEGPSSEPRPVTIVTSAARKKYDLAVRFALPEADAEGSFWDPLVTELKKIIARNRSTLIFVNSRSLCENLTGRVNEGEADPLAYAHHGSLSLEIRAEVERKLKAGELRAIIATNSLELGIDIGTLDEVVLVQSPFSISAAIQRVGRAGHRVGEMSRGTLFPTHPKDILEAAVLAQEIPEGDIETLKTIEAPLDVLAQVIVSMAGVETWDIDRLFESLRLSYPYRNVNREHFDLVLAMLAGRYADTRLRELRPLLSIDRLTNTVAARRGALQTLYLSGGVIPDRGYFHLRHLENKARIGELDEEFIWEASVGQTFTLGTQNWQIRQITHNDVFVLPAQPAAFAAPFWKGEEIGRDFHFSERIGEFLEEANRRLSEPGYAGALEARFLLEPSAAEALLEFLKKQKEITGCDLPHRRHIVLEFSQRGPGKAPGTQVIIHTFWGARVNRPFSLALDAAWEGRFGYRPETYVSNDCVVLLLSEEIRAEELLGLVTGARLESLLRNRLESSGFFGARFRECAGRALLLGRDRFHERLPLWLTRLRSQKLLEAVMQYPDFPLLLETWRTCLQDEFDLENLHTVLAELEAGALAWTEVRTPSPSPFAHSDWWRQVNQYMYMDDTPRGDRKSKLRGSLLQDILFSPGLRPTISRELVERFEMKRKRLSPGYAPQTARELLDWAEERLLIPEEEWEALLAAMGRDHGLEGDALLAEIGDRLLRLRAETGGGWLIARRDFVPRIVAALYGRDWPVQFTSLERVPLPGEFEEEGDDTREAEAAISLLGQWLQYYGPIALDRLQEILGGETERLQWALEDLIDSRKVIQGELVTGGGPEFCDAENFEYLLRLARKESQPSFTPLAIEYLPLFLARYQGILNPQTGIEGLYACIERVLCYPLEAALWEGEIFPARLRPYDPSWLDTTMQEGDLQWVGAEGHRIFFCFGPELDLTDPLVTRESVPDRDPPAHEGGQCPPAEITELFPDASGRYDFSSLLRLSKEPAADLAGRLWNCVWEGRVTNDSFIPLRRAVLSRFKWPILPKASGRVHHRRRRYGREKDSLSLPGYWRVVPRGELTDDLLEVEERRKDRVRLLLDRYGIIFRELLQRELPALRWAGVFRSLRIMELSGEVVSGYFFSGIPGPQFMSPEAFRFLQGKFPEDAVYWINAADPASLCGVPLDSLKGMLPARLPGTHLVFQGTRLGMVSRRNGKELTFFIPPDHPRISEFMDPLRHLLTRRFQPVRRIAIETINGVIGPESPYLPALRASFHIMIDYRNVNLDRPI